jgi:hypothetical protein
MEVIGGPNKLFNNKLDFAKAYDKVGWEFMFNVMEEMG